MRRRPRKRSKRRLAVGVLTAAVVIAGASGALRGAAADAWVIARLDDALAWLRISLAADWMHPSLAKAAAALMAAFCLSSTIGFIAAALLRVRFFIGFLVMSEVTRRQGRRASHVDLIVGLSAPVAVGVAVFAHGIVSLLAACHFVGVYAYVQLAYDPNCAEQFLGHYILRTRHPWDMASEESFSDEIDDAGDAES